jgi:hypothetical protein
VQNPRPRRSTRSAFMATRILAATPASGPSRKPIYYAGS